MNIKSREKLLAGVAALSFLGISPQQTFAAQITTSQQLDSFYSRVEYLDGRFEQADTRYDW